MAIKVSMYGADKDSDEYNAALKLKKNYSRYYAGQCNRRNCSVC